MLKIGDKDTKTIDIGVNDILNVMTDGGIAVGSFGAMVVAAEAIMKKSLLAGKGNWAAAAVMLVGGVATTLVQMYFADEINALDRLYIEFELEYQESTYTQQGATVKVKHWVAVDYNISIK